MNKTAKKPVDAAKFHKEYLAWKKESKGGKKRYFLVNVLGFSLICTAIFSIVIYFADTFWWKGELLWTNLLLYIAAFFGIYTVMLFVIYLFSWNKNTKKFAAYEQALMTLAERKLAEKKVEEIAAASEETPCDETHSSEEKE